MSPALTRHQVRAVDRIAVQQFAMSGLVLMENAGRNAAAVIINEIDRSNEASPDAPVKSVVIFCGPGNNGGDGFVVARHLTNAGCRVRIALAGQLDRLSQDASTNCRICQAMDIPITSAVDVAIGPNDVHVDALLGTGFSGDVRRPLADVIERINAAPKRCVVAIDVPSGLDCDTGQPASACVVADLTVTFVANKIGFTKANANRYTGRVVVADIGAPVQILRTVLNGP